MACRSALFFVVYGKWLFCMLRRKCIFCERLLLTELDKKGVLTFRRLAATAGILLAVALAVGVLCSLIGQTELGWRFWDSWIWQVRLSRLTMAAAVGAALAAAGMALQGMLRNPLAEPYVLGISSGAGVGVLVGLNFGAMIALPVLFATPLLALIGAILTCLIVYSISQRRGRLDPYVLLLSGVIVNIINGAIILTMLKFLRTNDQINFINWSMGQVPEYLWNNWSLIGLCWACVLIGWAVLFFRGPAFNMLGLGDDVAASSGVHIHWLRVETFFVVSLMTAAGVSLTGPVGFVGLIVPHVCRLIVGADH
ncbi:MAG: iron ABC transporter permease, partial [Planctomycetaceae bacterium]